MGRLRVSLGSLLAAVCFLILTTVVEAESYSYASYGEIVDRMKKLEQQYPNLIKVKSAQDEFGLPSVGECEDVKGEVVPCEIWFGEITNWESKLDGDGRPEMIVSGELHGDERIGPQASIAFMEMILEKYGKDDDFSRLIDYRLITVVPMTNAVAYFQDVREEVQEDGSDDPFSADPNRDFPFHQDPDSCMLTVAARAINELVITHLYRLMITFHGGANVIGYEWGDNGHCEGPICEIAPDNFAMHLLGERMQKYAGPAGTYEEEYVLGDMGETVYPVDGGMEDWAYGASWAGDSVPCEPLTLGGYDREKTTYVDWNPRCITYLVETATDKKPDSASLGTDQEVLKTGGKGDGHVPRNLRLLLAAADSLEPYVAEDEVTFEDSAIKFSWFIGGAFFVHDTLVEVSEVGSSQKIQGESLSGNASFPFAGDKNLFHAEVPYDKEGNDLLVRFVSVDTDKELSQKSDGKDPESHYVRARYDTNWNYDTGGSKVFGAQVICSVTWRVSPKTKQMTVESSPVDWDALEVATQDGEGEGDEENVDESGNDEGEYVSDDGYDGDYKYNENEYGTNDDGDAETKSGEGEGGGDNDDDGFFPATKWVRWTIIGGIVLAVLVIGLFAFQAFKTRPYDVVSIDEADLSMEEMDEDEIPLRRYP